MIQAIAALAGRAAAGEGAGAAVGAIKQLGQAAAGSAGQVGNLAREITQFGTGPLTALQRAIAPVAQLVELFNPALVMQFNLAMRDTLAVFGNALTPVLQGATTWVKGFGDAVAGLLPVVQPLAQAIGQYLVNATHGLVPLLQAAAPFIELLTDALADLLGRLSHGVAFFQGVLTELLSVLAEFFGLKSRYRPQSSEFMAFRNVQTSSVRQFADQAFASQAKYAFGNRDEQKSPQAAMAEIKDEIQKGRELVRAIANDVKVVADWFRTKVAQAEAVGDVAGFGAGDAGRIVGGLLGGLGALAMRRPW